MADNMWLRWLRPSLAGTRRVRKATVGYAWATWIVVEMARVWIGSSKPRRKVAFLDFGAASSVDKLGVLTCTGNINPMMAQLILLMVSAMGHLMATSVAGR